MVGGHRRMLQVYEHVEKVAAADATVLIRGESGTGKELVAEAIHRQSKRAGQPLVKVNCGALVESLLLSELFGHERGAFTGATQRKKGRFELADGGTIFLDEIGDISPKTQVALLRVLQEREFERVGGTSPIRVDVRVHLRHQPRPREDGGARRVPRGPLLPARTACGSSCPPLRERREDIPALAEHLLDRIAAERGGAPKRLTPAAERAARALRLAGQRARAGERAALGVALRRLRPARGRRLRRLPRAAGRRGRRRGEAEARRGGGSTRPGSRGRRRAPPSPYDQIRSLGWSLRDYKKHIEVECIRQALQEADGNITRAAELLGMKRPAALAAHQGTRHRARGSAVRRLS